MRLASALLPLLLATLPTPAAGQATTVILARHAEKAAPTGDPVLTPVGDQRAQDLARALADVRLAAVITTQYQRTRLTAAPVAQAAKLEVSIVTASASPLLAGPRFPISAMGSIRRCLSWSGQGEGNPSAWCGRNTGWRSRRR
jgi:phosphohistidine phosphatase SixA